MALFPQTILPLQRGYASNEEENISRNPSDAGQVQERDNWNRTRFVADMVFDAKTENAELIRNFWRANRTGPFDFFDYEESVVEFLKIGTGNGAELNFVVPAKAIRVGSYSVYWTDAGGLNPVLKTNVTHYNLVEGTGPVGQARVQHTVGNAPGAGKEVRIYFTGRRYYAVRWRERPTRETTMNRRQQIRVAVYEDFP